MTNSTETFWDVDGVSLQTYAFNITTLGGDRLAPPGLRGDNLVVPAAPGRRFMPKVVDSRTITLGMWVIGANEDGSVPSSSSAKFDENFRKLRRLLWTPNREVILTKRFYVDGVLKTASAKAQFAGGLSPSMNQRARAVFTVDLFLADPYFYGAEQVQTLSTGSQTVSIDGDDMTRAVRFTVDGPRKNVKIRNSTLNVDVEYHGDLNTGDNVNISVKDFTSVTDPSGMDPFRSVGSIRHSGDPFWFLLQDGDNTVVVSSDTGIGPVTMAYQEVWL